MSVPIEKLQLEKLLDERVFVKWVDQSGTTCTLGSCLYTNKQRPRFFMAAYRDMEEQIHIHFKLQVFVRLGNNKQLIDILFVVPPDADFANASTPYLISSIDDLSHDASAIHEAGLTNAQNVFLLQFKLAAKGFVVAKKKTTIRPYTTTANMLVHAFESLSNTTIFSVYIRPSTYAKVHLEKLRMYISKTPTDVRNTNLKEMYIQQGAMLLDWDEFGYTEQQRPIPPLYAQASPEVQVPRSPPLHTRLSPEAQVSRSSLVIFKETIEETPPRSPPSSNSTSVHGIFSPSCEEAPVRTPTSPKSTSVHGIFSPSCEEAPARTPTSPKSASVQGIFSPSYEELSDGEVDLENIEKDIGMDFDIDSDEEQLAKEQFASLISEEQNRQASQILNSKLAKWMGTVVLINPDINDHKRLNTKLLTLGIYIRTSNTKGFDAALLWCSALFFYDPLDSDSNNTLGLWEERNLWLIKDIAKQILWADKVRSSTEMSSSLLGHFLKLGDAARTVALDPRSEFGKPDSMSKENNKPVSGKSLGTDRNTPKRVKM
ncbi:hypothetical protein ACMFMF_010295 [Clarireedia jacksonii]